ncbi:hypothetical protein IWW56_005202 [Coemansia sp. RSA 2131]|nr:hypothetical protein IWW56_005202 [Coemansia sp. RSA 2131]
MAGVDTTSVSQGAGEMAQATSTAELTKMIRTAGEALDQALQTSGADYFGAQLEGLRNDILELFRRLLVRNPYSSHRKDAVSKMWFRAIYPTIEQYRSSIRQVEAEITQAGRSTDNAKSSDGNTLGARRELSQWRARFHTFLLAATGMLLRLVAELAEAHALAPSSAPNGVLDRQTLDTHAYGLELVDSLRSELHAGLTPVQRATLAIVSKLLTHLGDLARYRILYTKKLSDVDAERMWQMAKGFYRSAIRVAPHRGQAHNQLAVIFGYERNSLDGVFAYYRALTAQYRFIPAEANLRTILDNALRAVDKPGARSVDATSGYVYCEQRMYDKYTMLRYLFAFHQPQAKETVTRSQLAALVPDAETLLVAEIRRACTAFVRGVTSGAIEERQAVMAHAIQLFEQQQLACLNPGDKETRMHDTAIARVSAMSVALTAQLMCQSEQRPKQNAAMSESQRTEQATPLVDTERDEVVSPAMRAHQMLNMQQSRQAIGAQRVAGTQQAASGPLYSIQATSGPLYSAQPVTSGPLYSMPSASGPLYSAQPAVSGPLYSVQTTLAQSPPSEQLEPPAMHVWQQYQVEHQRKVALQQQLEEQHRIQQMLHYQLLAQQQQQHTLRNPSMREARSFDLDATTASVVSMALSMPQDKLSIYQQYSAMNIATPTMTAQTAALVPSLHPSLSLSSVGSSAYPWTSPMLMPSTRNVPASRDLDFGLQPMPAPFNRMQNNMYGANPMYYSEGVPLKERL